MLQIQSRDADPLSETSLSNEGLQEDDLREWILRNPREFFDENFMIIGREVNIDGIGDGIDILAIDRDGNLVVIELKRGTLRGNVDFQSLRYVSYISRWEYRQIKKEFEKFGLVESLIR